MAAVFHAAEEVLRDFAARDNKKFSLILTHLLLLAIRNYEEEFWKAFAKKFFFFAFFFFLA
ncbi:unnamed protein product [Brassica napus]|uniref:(rape) hypothetical protein n=1 Tax=Brassica napus TaxID=3708 RepID=A0A817BR27_BRANA|nr:unnamed protein product [Brassica napus]